MKSSTQATESATVLRIGIGETAAILHLLGLGYGIPAADVNAGMATLAANGFVHFGVNGQARPTQMLTDTMMPAASPQALVRTLVGGRVEMSSIRGDRAVRFHPAGGDLRLEALNVPSLFETVRRESALAEPLANIPAGWAGPAHEGESPRSFRAAAAVSLVPPRQPDAAAPTALCLVDPGGFTWVESGRIAFAETADELAALIAGFIGPGAQ